MRYKKNCERVIEAVRNAGQKMFTKTSQTAAVSVESNLTRTALLSLTKLYCLVTEGHTYE